MKVMDIFEMGSLKDQKLNVKQLVLKPEFKQQYLAPLRALSIDDQYSILTKVVQKEIPLNSIKRPFQTSEINHYSEDTVCLVD